MAPFTMGTGGHSFTMLPADRSISTAHDPLPSSFYMVKCAVESIYTTLADRWSSSTCILCM